jgi:chemotaxis signal transduction protein
VGASTIGIVAFRVGTRYFGIPVAQVDGVIQVTEITPLADVPELVRGFVTIEGNLFEATGYRVSVAADRLDGWNLL